MPARSSDPRSATTLKTAAPPKHAQLRETSRRQIEALPADQLIPPEHVRGGAQIPH